MMWSWYIFITKNLFKCTFNERFLSSLILHISVHHKYSCEIFNHRRERESGDVVGLAEYCFRNRISAVFLYFLCVYSDKSGEFVISTQQWIEFLARYLTHWNGHSQLWINQYSLDKKIVFTARISLVAIIAPYECVYFPTDFFVFCCFGVTVKISFNYAVFAWRSVSHIRWNNFFVYQMSIALLSITDDSNYAKWS